MNSFSVRVTAEALYTREVILPPTPGRSSDYERGQHPIAAALDTVRLPALAEVPGLPGWTAAGGDFDVRHAACGYEVRKEGGYAVTLVARLKAWRTDIVHAEDAARAAAVLVPAADWPAAIGEWSFAAGSFASGIPEAVEAAPSGMRGYGG